MMVQAIKFIAIALVLFGIGIVVYCSANGIGSIHDYRDFRAMRSVREPIVDALADGTLTLGSTRQQMLAIATPIWTEDYGRYKIHGYKPRPSYDRQTIVTVDDRLVSASVGSCTWSWSFFDETPQDVSETVGAVRGLREVIERMPQYAAILKPKLDEHLRTLGMTKGDKESAELIRAPESELQGF
jgi:hypothetical protein